MQRKTTKENHPDLELHGSNHLKTHFYNHSQLMVHAFSVGDYGIILSCSLFRNRRRSTSLNFLCAKPQCRISIFVPLLSTSQFLITTIIDVASLFGKWQTFLFVPVQIWLNIVPWSINRKGTALIRIFWPDISTKSCVSLVFIFLYSEHALDDVDGNPFLQLFYSGPI